MRMLSASMRLTRSLSSRITANELTDLPDPDSPTRPKVRPAITSRSMPWTASTHWLSCLKATLRFLMESNGSVISLYFVQK